LAALEGRQAKAVRHGYNGSLKRGGNCRGSHFFRQEYWNMQGSFRLTLAAAISALVLSGCTGMQQIPSDEQAPIVDLTQVLDAPPAAGSIQQKNDEKYYNLGRKLRNTARGERIKIDADRCFPEPLRLWMGDIIGVKLSAEKTPETWRFFDMSQPVLLGAQRKAKKYFSRPRPFARYNPKDQTCRPDQREGLGKFKSYPSGHTTTGWYAALVFASLVPDKAEEILREGYMMGESRWICGAHWKSDVEAGRVTGAALFARVIGDPAFRAQLERAREEIAALRSH
jgi:acid phosphatase (class A)